ncbi:class I SAM-dependent methyltransferase [Eisenibacter elegans]|jgi:ubiquinone/menaquinone biosynthesis C-methylase UbiE|uniref:class I SAM-dependent methyltransferase n=1 Tax=Eisenibacter elegans TaxID=997 RepID=UPI0003FD4513|nr:class I SAM-dependent methyltransferase [Eisenibacter elegans]
MYSTTEITSTALSSDNPIHQRLLAAYLVAQPHLWGEVLEIGCGVGRGLEIIRQKAQQYTALDKNKSLLESLSAQYPDVRFIEANVPPLSALPDNSFDCVVSFQVIEHIQDDGLFLDEIRRVLKPGGKAFISTPNRLRSLTRNPWHTREYTAEELSARMKPYFSTIEALGIDGSEKVQAYMAENAAAVKRITRWDILNLQYRLPAWMLRVPYEWLNRRNRNRLQNQNQNLVSNITEADYHLSDTPQKSLDLFYIATK